MTDPRWRSPLSHRDPIISGSDLSLQEIAFLNLFIVRGALQELRQLGLVLPAAVGETLEAESYSAMWIGPDQWLIVAQERTIASAPIMTSPTMVDVSDYYTCIGVSGAQARHALAKLTAIDLHPRAFQASRAVATLMAKSSVWLWMTSSQPDTFRVFVRRSHADYLWCLLAEIGREWGLPSQDPIGKVRLRA